MPLMIISNACYGLTSIMYNAYLPLLVKAHPDVRKLRQAGAASTSGDVPTFNTDIVGAPPKNTSASHEALEAELKYGNEWSNKGFAWGYVAGVISIILCIPFVFIFTEIAAYQIAMAITGVWWVIFLYKPWKYLQVSAMHMFL
jgi:MFS-type transporter involved in bile tolerance (Atg22 family)